MNETVWETKFIVEDIYSQSEDFREAADKMDDKQLEKFVNDNIGNWQKGFNSGMMTDWDVVAETVADTYNTNYPQKEEAE